MTTLLAGPVLPALRTRGSTHVSAAALLVLGLGSLVLLIGLAPPEPATNDVVSLVVPSGADGSTLPLWLAGTAMLGAALMVMGLGRRVQSLLLFAVARV